MSEAHPSLDPLYYEPESYFLPAGDKGTQRHSLPAIALNDFPSSELPSQLDPKSWP